MATTFHIGVDLSQLLNLAPALSREVFPRLHEAVGRVAQQAFNGWADSVKKAGLWNVEAGQYISSMKWEYTGDFSAVVSAGYQYASDIETGRPARDLKLMLNTSTKTRVSKKGNRYLIIPIRHNVRSMPIEVYQQARDLAASMVTGMGQRDNQIGFHAIRSRSPIQVAQRSYQWGKSLNGPDIEKRHVGMYRFNTPSTATEKRSSYMTFRVMSEKSTGWIVPPKPGLYLAKQVTERIGPIAEQVFRKAVTLGLNL